MTKQELEQKHDKFLSDFNNKYIKVLPNNYPPQCFDQAVKWTDLLGIPHAPGNPSPFPYPNAYQIYTDFGAFQAQYFDRVENTATYVPKKGDVMVWAGAYNGGVGHVGTATGKGDTNTFECFEQNDPTGSNAHLRTYNYNHVLGALRYKVSGATPPMDNNVKKAVQFDRVLTFLKSVGWIQSDDSNLFLDNDKFVALVKGLWADRIVDRPKASITDQLRNMTGLPNGTAQQIADKLKVCSPAELAKAKEEGRKLGVQQVKDTVNKLA